MRIAAARIIAAAFWTATAWYALLAAIPAEAEMTHEGI